MTLHKEGYKIVTGSLLGAALLLWVNHQFLKQWPLAYYPFALAVLVLLYLVIQFFRLPSRKNTSIEGQLVAPCDGKVVVIEEVEEPEYFQGKRMQVSIFMSPLNVHCNWVPCEGSVSYVKYHPGKYLVAWHPKSSTENERSTIVFKGKNGKEVLVRQVAGAVARRIIFYMRENMQVRKNDELGFIRFGSRVDLYFPLDTKIIAKIGDVTKGNETVIAEW
jgi:phosphatidylserine decarboxylase